MKYTHRERVRGGRSLEEAQTGEDIIIIIIIFIYVIRALERIVNIRELYVIHTHMLYTMTW